MKGTLRKTLTQKELEVFSISDRKPSKRDIQGTPARREIPKVGKLSAACRKGKPGIVHHNCSVLGCDCECHKTRFG